MANLIDLVHGGSGGGFTWTTQTAVYVASDNDGILADTITVGAFTVTLPDNPAQGEKVKIMDGALAGGFSTNNLTVAAGLGGATLLNTASPFIIDTDFGWIEAVYEAASNDWRLMGPGVGPGGGGGSGGTSGARARSHRPGWRAARALGRPVRRLPGGTGRAWQEEPGLPSYLSGG